jgi:PAS domain S-box-containing protein
MGKDQTSHKSLSKARITDTPLPADSTDTVNEVDDLQKDNQRYRDLIDSLPLSVFEIDGRAEVIFANRHAIKVSGYSSEKLLGMPATQLLIPEDKGRIKDSIGKIFKGEKVSGNEYTLLRKNGSTFPAVIYSNPTIHDGHPVGITGIIVDITESKQARLKVEEQLRFLKTLMDTIPNPVFYKDMEGKYTGCNEAFLEFLGKTSEEIIGKTVYDVASEETATKYFEKDGELFKTRGKQCYEWEAKRKNGEIRNVIFNKAIIKDINGNPQGLIGVISDITERKLAEEEIRRHELSLEKMVDERSAALRRTNERLQTELAERKRISRIFQARAHLFEYAGKHSLDELLEEILNSVENLTASVISFYHFVDSDQQSLLLQNWSTRTKNTFCSADGKGSHYEIALAGVWVDCFHQRKPVIHNDYESLPHKKGLPPGHAKVVRELVVPVFRGNKIVAILGIGNKPGDYDQRDIEVVSMIADLAWDITEQKSAEEKIRKLNDTLEQRVASRTAELESRARQLQQLALELSDAEDRERRRIASVLHDDFQQELAYVKMELGILGKNADKNIQQRLDFLEQLLGGSIEKSRNLSYEINPPALLRSGLLAALKVLIQDMKEKFGISVKMRAHSGAEPDSLALASILYRSIRELLLNVLKHAGVNSAVMNIRVKSGMIHIRIEDTGNGFVYNPVRSRIGKGAGFGLYSIEDRIAFLGGTIKIKTAPGKGCRVELTVPRNVSRETAMPATGCAEMLKPEWMGNASFDPAQPFDVSNRIRILLADDHQLMRETLATLLNDCEGMTIVGQARDGYEVIQLAAQLKPHVILMDVTMPGLDGFQATEKISRDHPEIHIIGLSVHNDAHTRQKMRDAGAGAYLTKTGSPVTLVETIRRVHHGKK